MHTNEKHPNQQNFLLAFCENNFSTFYINAPPPPPPGEQEKRKTLGDMSFRSFRKKNETIVE